MQFPTPIGKPLQTPLDIPHRPPKEASQAAPAEPAPAEPEPETRETPAETGDSSPEAQKSYKLALDMIAAGHPDRAESRLEKAIDLASHAGDWATLGPASLKLGKLYQTKGDDDRAETLLNRSLEPLRRLNDHASLCETYGALAGLARKHANLHRAQEMFQRQLEVAQRANLKPQQALALGKLATVRLELNDLDSAETFARKGLEAALAGSDRAGLVRAYINLASIYRKKGDRTNSCVFASKACRIYAMAGQTADADECAAAARHDLHCDDARQKPQPARTPEAASDPSSRKTDRQASPVQGKPEPRPAEGALPVRMRTTALRPRRPPGPAQRSPAPEPEPQPSPPRPARAAETAAPPAAEEPEGRGGPARWLREARRQRRAKKLSAAMSSLKKALAGAESARDRRLAAAIWSEMAHTLLAREDVDEAERAFEKSLHLYKELGLSDGAARTSSAFGLALRTRGRFRKAEKMFNEAIGLDGAASRRAELIKDYHNLGVLRQLWGKQDLAEQAFKKSLELNKKFPGGKTAAQTYAALGQIYFERGDLNRAADMFKKAIALENAAGQKSSAAVDYSNLGAVYQRKDDMGKACGYWRKARKLLRGTGQKTKLERVEEMLRRDACARQNPGKSAANSLR
jgi:tetratricopeptide (TPR) repeat protein